MLHFSDNQKNPLKFLFFSSSSSSLSFLFLTTSYFMLVLSRFRQLVLNDYNSFFFFALAIYFRADNKQNENGIYYIAIIKSTNEMFPFRRIETFLRVKKKREEKNTISVRSFQNCEMYDETITCEFHSRSFIRIIY